MDRESSISPRRRKINAIADIINEAYKARYACEEGDIDRALRRLRVVETLVKIAIATLEEGN